MNQDKPILHLNLKKKWFDMILNGEKKEEYRAMTDYWRVRFGSPYITIKGVRYHPTDVVICFSNGYKRDRPQLFIECEYMRPGKGNPKWGFVEYCYVIGLGKLLETRNIV